MGRWPNTRRPDTATDLRRASRVHLGFPDSHPARHGWIGTKKRPVNGWQEIWASIALNIQVHCPGKAIIQPNRIAVKGDFHRATCRPRRMNNHPGEQFKACPGSRNALLSFTATRTATEPTSGHLDGQETHLDSFARPSCPK